MRFASLQRLALTLLAFAALCTWMTANIAHSRFGRSLVAVRDAEVAAEATGIRKSALLVTVFLFVGGMGAASANAADLKTAQTSAARLAAMLDKFA